MTEIETAAVEFIHARDGKALAKAERNSCKCTEQDAGDPEIGDMGTPPCWKSPEYGLCKKCKERVKWHERVLQATPKVIHTLARLRRLIHKLPKGGYPK